MIDLQAGSIWRDLAAVLPRYQGIILDVGCGAQPYRSLIDPKATYIGIDYAFAEEHFGYSMPDTTYYEGDVWPVADSSVDVVLCTETLEHVPDPPAFLAEAARCLKPSGHLVMTVPFAARWHFVPHDYWRFTPLALHQLLTGSGFTQVAVFARGNAVTVASYKVMALSLPLLFPQSGGALRRLVLWGCGVLTLPAFLTLAGIAWISMSGQGGDDCLGFTVLAEKPDSTP